MSVAVPGTSDTLLEVSDVVAGFGATTVLHRLSLSVRAGEVSGVFGLNGAGKSVTMKVLAGVVPVRSGRIIYAGRDITAMAPEARVAAGIAHVPQGRQVFGALSVEQNLRLGAYTLRRRDRSRYGGVLDGVLGRFPILAERLTQVAGTMSGGQQASLAVARALMAEPKLILVDEPSAGLAPIVVQELLATLRAVAASGVTMVLVEQNVAFGLQVVDTANVLQQGRIVHTGSVAELDPDSLARYLGIGRLLGSGVARSVASRSARSPASGPAREGPAVVPTGAPAQPRVLARRPRRVEEAASTGPRPGRRLAAVAVPPRARRPVRPSVGERANPAPRSGTPTTAVAPGRKGATKAAAPGGRGATKVAAPGGKGATTAAALRGKGATKAAAPGGRGATTAAVGPGDRAGSSPRRGATTSPRRSASTESEPPRPAPVTRRPRSST